MYNFNLADEDAEYPCIQNLVGLLPEFFKRAARSPYYAESPNSRPILPKIAFFIVKSHWSILNFEVPPRISMPSLEFNDWKPFLKNIRHFIKIWC